MKKKSLAGNVFMLLILVGLVYLWFPRKSHQVLWTDKTLSNLFSPFQQALGGVAQFVSNLKSNYIYLKNAAIENAELKTTLQQQKIKIQDLEQKLATQANELKLQNQYATKKLLPVTVVSEDPFVVSKSLMINAGRNQGVRINDVVVTGDGLVGRILKVYDDSSQVLLVTDPHFRVDAMSLKTNNRIILRGVDTDLLWGKDYPFLTQTEFLLHEQAFENGEKLVTSGFGGLYPAGIPVGQIVDIKAKSSGLFSEADILPAVDFMKRLDLFVLLN